MKAIAKIRYWLNCVVDDLMQQPKHLLTFRLTALLLLLYSPPYENLSDFVLPICCGVLLIYPKLLNQRLIWFAIAAFFVGTNVRFWFTFDNHHYLATYWCLVCLLAAGQKNSDSEEILQWNGRILIGLCFFLATFWKLIANQYFDGSLLHLTFLLDSRLDMSAFLFGGLESHVLQSNRELYSQLYISNPGTELTLTSSPRLSSFSLVLSYWTLLCEGAIALAFLSPRPQWLHNCRDWLLIFFIFSTYPFTPIFGFAALLLVIGFAQCPRDRSIGLLVYLLLLVLIPVWVNLPETVFNLFIN